MRRILLTQRLVAADHGEIRECLDVRWGELLAAAGFLPLAASLAADPANLVQIPELAGVILTGGNDLAQVSDSILSRRRDDFEHALVGAAEARNIPVLGVCRGAQFLAARAGTALIPVTGHAGSVHDLVFTAGNSGEIISQTCAGRTQTRSYHDWAIASVPPGYRIAAMAKDDTIEAFENTDAQQFGIMWHPERDVPFAPASITLLHRIFGS